MSHATKVPETGELVRERSHKLSNAQREWIVRRLAARDSPTAIRSGVRERFGIEISRQTIESYDPTRNPQCGRRWTALYRDVRKDHGACHADLTAGARQVERLARRIVEILERRILAGPGSAARGCVKKAGAITDQDRLRALTGFVARLRVTDPAGLAAIRRALFDNGGHIARCRMPAVRRTSMGDAHAVFAKAPRRATARFDAAFGREIAAVWTPDPRNRPQVEAYESKADLMLYGGAAGGGKTDLLLGLALTRHACSVIFGRAYAALAGVEQRLIEILGSRDGYNRADMILNRPGCLLEFGALDRPRSEFSWQGRPHDFIGFDEGAQLDERNVRFVMCWLRSTDPDQRCRVVIASNPPIGGQGEWLMTWFAPWLDDAFPNPARSGELRWRCTRADGTIAWVDGPGPHDIDGVPLVAISCTFIPARLSDNRYLSDATGHRRAACGSVSSSGRDRWATW